MPEPVDAAVAAPSPLSTLTDDERLFRDSVRAFAVDRVAPLARAMDEQQALDNDLLRALFALGVMGIEVPEVHGGAGGTFFHATLAIEELSRVDPAVGVVVDVHNTLVINALLRWGTPAQQASVLPRLASTSLGAYALSEPEAGSDAFALTTRAERDGDAYVLRGRKVWITNAREADVFIVFATIDPSAGYRGITAFLVDASAVLGEPGRGYKVAIETLNEGRIGIGAQMVGLAQGALDHTIAYVKTRRQFGKAIADFQGVQFQLARAATDLEAARLLVYNAARLRDAGLPFLHEAAMCKILSSEVAERVASMAVNLYGGYGFVRDYPVEKLFRDAKIGQIYEGTSNMQLATIAKQLLL